MEIKRYKRGTPKPFSVSVSKFVEDEKGAAALVTASQDKKASAKKIEGGFVVSYRLWFDTPEAAQAFVDETGKEVAAALEKEAADKASILKVRTDLTKMVALMSSRGRKDLAKKTQDTLSKL